MGDAHDNGIHLGFGKRCIDENGRSRDRHRTHRIGVVLQPVKVALDRLRKNRDLGRNYKFFDRISKKKVKGSVNIY